MKHLGAISKITKAAITVSLEGNINCEGCKAKAACGVSESNSKEIEIEHPQVIQTNDHQNFLLNEVGIKSCFLGLCVSIYFIDQCTTYCVLVLH